MTTNRISLDFETRSRCDLEACGAYRYAEDPSTEVLVIAVSHNGGPVTTWDARDTLMDDGQEHHTLHILRRAIEEGWEIQAFNNQFEWVVLKYVCPRQFGFPVPDINRMRCTQAVCRSAGLPGSLGACADFLKLPVRKDKLGLPLIKKFSIPQEDGSFIEPDTDTTFTLGGEKVTAAAAFQMFVDYCRRDVETEMAVASAMTPFELKGIALDTFLFTSRMNDKGVPVDRMALESAMSHYREYEAELSERFRAVTGLTPGQNVRFLEWVRERGYKGKSLDAAARARYGSGEAITDEAKEALKIKGELSYAAVKKIPTMLDWVMSDDVLRGSFLWCGAQKTGRWTSKGPQWQNMKKPPKSLRPVIEEAFEDVKQRLPLFLLSFIYGNPYGVIASLSRYFVRFKDEMIFDLDFSQVEAKILPFLIGAKRILDKFGSGEDLYVTTGNRLGIDRDMGKTVVLATQFQGGWKAVFNATGKTWDRARCEEAVRVVREENPEFPKGWAACQNAFIAAMERPEKWHSANQYCAYAYTTKPPFPRMMLRLPSGRKICLPLPERAPITMAKVEVRSKDGKEVVETRWDRVAGHVDDEQAAKMLSCGDPFLNPNASVVSSFHTWELSFYGHIENKLYGRVGCYGGDLLQTQTQAVGVDLLANGVLEAEKAGFDPFFVVHDQCLAPAVGDPEAFTKALCTVPAWFRGFPLDAATDIVRSYCKQ